MSRNRNKHKTKPSSNSKYAIFGAASVAAIAGVCWLLLPSGASRQPASTTSASSKTDDPKKGKSIQELQSDFRNKLSEQKKSKEYIWGETGHTELVIQNYKDLLAKPGSRPREERVRMINILAQTVKPRKEWPKDFNFQKAVDVMDLFTSILRGDTRIAGEAIAAVRTSAIWGHTIPELRNRADNMIYEYYESDSRPGPRGECLQSLAALGSDRGFQLVKKSLHSSDPAIVRAAVYSTAEYFKTARDTQARKVLLDYSKSSTGITKAISVKLLAREGDRKIASVVPGMLHDNSTAPEIEAGAYAAGNLKLKELKPTLEHLLKTVRDPYLLNDINMALKQINS